MRLNVAMLLCALAGVLGGGALIGVWALGLCLIFDSLALGVFALLRDDGRPQPGIHAVPSIGHTVDEVLDRFRAS